MAYERKYKVTSSLQGAYSLYEEKYEKIDKKLYFDIVYDILKTISHMIITESFEYRIPEKLGYLRIRKKKPKLKIKNGKIDINKNIIDWKATWEYWDSYYPNKTRSEIRNIKDKPGVIFQINKHTNGEVMSWFWDKNTCNAKNNSVYSFSPVKGGLFEGMYRGRLGLGAWIKSSDKKNDYYY